MMATATQENRVFQGMGWMIGSVTVLFLVSAGLEIFVRQTFRQASVATILLALSLASWSYILGFVGLFFFSVWWLVKLWRVGAKRVVLSRYSFAGSSSRRLDNPELQDSQSPSMEHGICREDDIDKQLTQSLLGWEKGQILFHDERTFGARDVRTRPRAEGLVAGGTNRTNTRRAVP